MNFTTYIILRWGELFYWLACNDVKWSGTELDHNGTFANIEKKACARFHVITNFHDYSWKNVKCNET